ncbi:hypothetical protein [Blastococcus haudaquaticus]|uniref:DUF732 domain-containing protein n=1 Tax=Blastococcus haudaquaticus TaxID=1938745 RepID=A0A286GYL1_9ACTN|nr:hypothetical protein [Blastococcus haudaquaticus]SOE00189.1 hypothetical protein SAMN06272739_2444 [Blastococcus haudaquaticus]
MSCSDRRPARTVVALAALAVLGTTAACGAEEPATGPAAATPSSTPSSTPADATTGRIAEIEFARQCTVASVNYADEAQFTIELDTHLAAAGFSHEQWKQWHDALVVSPELVTQFAEISAAGCPAEPTGRTPADEEPAG